MAKRYVIIGYISKDCDLCNRILALNVIFDRETNTIMHTCVTCSPKDTEKAKENEYMRVVS